MDRSGREHPRGILSLVQCFVAVILPPPPGPGNQAVPLSGIFKWMPPTFVNLDSRSSGRSRSKCYSKNPMVLGAGEENSHF